jgi:tRNA pseudouridine55 synthase|tara:strand:+ start:140 stop:1021 length:882 start_codon:yes stop_codon:yes gene_type:complete
MKLELNSNFYLINKPKSWTSQDLCSKFKKLYNFNKVGHSGTLDPNATGLMLIATNKYTKLFDYITNKDKTYVVKTLFGYDSETLDIDSNYEKIHEIDLNKIKDEFINAVNNKKGESLQIPPKYSAVKVKGKRLYKYAREGKEVEIPKRKINVKKIEIIKIDNETAEIKVKVSEGTYIRSLISDIAKSLNTVAIVSDLERISIGNLDINHNCFISNIEELNNKFIPNSISSDEIIDLPVINVKEKDLDNIKNGELMSNTFFKTKEIYILKYEGNVVATYKPFNEEYFKPDKVIL